MNFGKLYALVTMGIHQMHGKQNLATPLSLIYIKRYSNGLYFGVLEKDWMDQNKSFTSSLVITVYITISCLKIFNTAA